MKVLYVKPVAGSDAIAFDEVYGDKFNLALWIRIKTGFKLYDSINRVFFDVEALEFKEVDPEFIKFVKEKFVDYDMLKDTNFYVCEG